MVAVIIAIIAIGASNQASNQTKELGAFGTRFPNGVAVGTNATVDTAGDFSVGANGTQLAEIIAGSCSLINFGYGTVLATSTRNYDCAVTGVTSGDLVFTTATNTVPTLLPGGGNQTPPWFISGAAASSTSGYITVSLTNMSGTANVPPGVIASSTRYLIIDAD